MEWHRCPEHECDYRFATLRRMAQPPVIVHTEDGHEVVKLNLDAKPDWLAE